MSFNPLKEKGVSLSKQLRSWHDIAHRKFNKYSRKYINTNWFRYILNSI